MTVILKTHISLHGQQHHGHCLQTLDSVWDQKLSMLSSRISQTEQDIFLQRLVFRHISRMKLTMKLFGLIRVVNSSVQLMNRCSHILQILLIQKYAQKSQVSLVLQVLSVCSTPTMFLQKTVQVSFILHLPSVKKITRFSVEAVFQTFSLWMQNVNSQRKLLTIRESL